MPQICCGENEKTWVEDTRELVVTFASRCLESSRKEKDQSGTTWTGGLWIVVGKVFLFVDGLDFLDRYPGSVAPETLNYPQGACACLDEIISWLLGDGTSFVRLRHCCSINDHTRQDTGRSPGNTKSSTAPTQTKTTGTRNLQGDTRRPQTGDGRVLHEIISGTQSRRQGAGLYQRSPIERSHDEVSLQGRRHGAVFANSSHRGLGSNIRLGCLFQSRDSHREVTKTLSDNNRRSDSSICVGDLRPPRSSSVHAQPHQASVGSSSVIGTQIWGADRRLGMDSRMFHGVLGSGTAGNRFELHTRVHIERERIIDPSTAIRTPGDAHRHETGQLFPDKQESQVNHCNRVLSSAISSAGTSSRRQGVGVFHREAQRSTTLRRPTSDYVQGTAADPERNSSIQVMGLESSSDPGRGLSSSMVGDSHRQGERSVVSTGESSASHHEGCLTVGLGGSPGGDRSVGHGILGQKRRRISFDGHGGFGGHQGGGVIHSAQQPQEHGDRDKIRRDDVGVILEQTGGTSCSPERPCDQLHQEDVVGEGHHVHSNTHPRGTQRDSRPTQQGDECLDRTRTSPDLVPIAGDDLGIPHSGPHGIGEQPQGGEVHQLVGGSAERGSGRIHNGSEPGGQPLRFPDGPNDSQAFEPDPHSEDTTIDNSYPVVAQSSMVPGFDPDGDGSPGRAQSSSSNVETSPDAGGARVGTSTLDTDRISYLRQRLSAAGLSEEAFTRLLRNWRGKNVDGKAHDKPFRNWVRYAQGAGIAHEDPQLVDVINFASLILTGDQSEELGPASIANLKLHVAAISVTYGLASQGRFTMDENLLLSRFRKAAKESLPTKPPSSYGWTLAQLFDLIHEQFSSQSLSDTQLRQKALLLIRVDTCCRSDDLTGLFRENIKFSDPVDGAPTTMQFRLYRPKESGMSNIDWTELTTIQSPDRLFRGSDTVSTVREYMDRTALQATRCEPKVRVGSTAFTPLFVSLNAQSRDGKVGRCSPITAQRLAKIAKEALTSIGVSGEEDGPHSIRGVSAAHEFAVTSDLDAVTRRGRWASSSTFTTFYNKRFASGKPVIHLPQHMLCNIANVLRGSSELAKSSTGTTGDDPVSPASPDAVGLGRTTRTRRGQEPRTHEQRGDGPLTSRPTVGDIVVFPKGLFDDAPNRRVRGLVLGQSRKEWALEAQCDKSTLHIPKRLMAEMLSSGTAHVIGSWSH